MKNKVLGLKNLLWAAAAFIIIICIAVSLTVMCRQIYYYDINNLNIPEKTGISEEICRKNYDILIDYNMIVSPDVLEFEDFELNETETIHFKEVKAIFCTMQWVSFVGTIIIILKIITQLKRENRDFRWLKYTLPMGIGITSAIGILVAVNWKLAFKLMHEIFFRNDYWIFQIREGGIINILPDKFFMHCGIAIMVMTAVMTVGAYILFRKLSRK